MCEFLIYGMVLPSCSQLGFNIFRNLEEYRPIESFTHGSLLQESGPIIATFNVAQNSSIT